MKSIHPGLGQQLELARNSEDFHKRGEFFSCTSDSTFGIVVTPVVLLIPTGDLQRIVTIRPDIMPDLFMSRNLICTEAVVQFFHLPERKPVEVDPRAIDAGQGLVQLFLIVLATLE